MCIFHDVNTIAGIKGSLQALGYALTTVQNNFLWYIGQSCSSICFSSHWVNHLFEQNRKHVQHSVQFKLRVWIQIILSVYILTWYGNISNIKFGHIVNTATKLTGHNQWRLLTLHKVATKKSYSNIQFVLKHM